LSDAKSLAPCSVCGRGFDADYVIELEGRR
jgi:hypothetical protein